MHDIDLVKIILALCAIYCFGAWIYTFILLRLRKTELVAQERRDIERFTFHLGICGIVALGFLGIILAFQGA